MTLDEKMIEHGFLMHDFHSTFKLEDGSRADICKVIEQYSNYWPWEAEDIIVLMMRFKRIEYLLSEDEEKEIFEHIEDQYYFGNITIMNIIVESIEERIGLI